LLEADAINHGGETVLLFFSLASGECLGQHGRLQEIDNVVGGFDSVSQSKEVVRVTTVECESLNEALRVMAPAKEHHDGVAEFFILDETRDQVLAKIDNFE